MISAEHTSWRSSLIHLFALTA